MALNGARDCFNGSFSETKIILAAFIISQILIVHPCEHITVITVTENIPYPSSSLLDVANLLLTSSLISQTEKDNIYFTDRKNSQPFSLSHGKLIVAGPLDREKICSPQTDQNLIQKCCESSCCMFIGITSANRKINYIRVNIEDENDNEPIFPQSYIKIAVHENVEIGHMIILPKAEDLDTPSFGIDSYKLISDKSCGSCFEVKNEPKDSRLVLVFKTKIDREVNSVFNLQVLAIDRGKPSKTGSLSILLEVEDINDNNPHFEESTITLAVEENGRSGREIKRIKVTDSDIGVNSQLSYSIEDFTSQAQRYFKLFQIKDGISLQLQSTLDYENKNLFEFRIIARDHGTPYLLSTATVTVRVTNVNDEPPEILFYNRGSIIDPNSIQLTQPENGPKHQPIILIHVTDKDSKLADIHCEVSHPKDIFYLRETENVNIIEKKKIYELQNLVEFDRETTSIYRISITCSDSNTMSKLTHSVEIQMKIEDINDNPPIFSSSFYFGKIMETDLIDQDVQMSDGVIQVTDADIGMNSRIKYHLKDLPNSTDSQYFSVNSEYPQIKNKEPIDYEKSKQFKFFLVAVDGGKPALTASSQITISVSDANDNRPEIETKFYTFSVLEEQPIGTKIGQIVATDADTDQLNRDVIFEMLSLDGTKKKQRQNDLFIIENNTGFIKTRVVLDHEKDQHVSFMVRVRNTNEFVGNKDKSDYYSSSVAITVKIIDINDNSPKLALKDSPRPDQAGSCLSSQKAIVITTSDIASNICSEFPYTFVDADEGLNAELVVTLKENPNFSLDMGHNLICLKNIHLSPGYFTVNVIGQDRNGGNGSRRAECLINIHLKSSIIKIPINNPKTRPSEPQEKMIDTKTIVIFIVLIAVIIIFCLLLMIVVFKSKLCLPGPISPPARRRGKLNEKQINSNTSKMYSTINAVANCENKRLCDDYMSGGLNNYRTVTPNYSNNVFITRTNSPSNDVRIIKYPISPENRFTTITRSCDELFNEQDETVNCNSVNSPNSDMKYEQLHGIAPHLDLSNNTITWDKAAAHQYNYLLEPRDSGSLPSNCKNFTSKQEPNPISTNLHQKSINDVYLQTSFV